MEQKKNKRLIAIYPGRFQLPHRGHLSVYKKLCEDFEEVYITTSDKTDDTFSPFSFEEKENLLNALGIPKQNIIKCVSPYTPDEILDHVDDENTTVVVAVGEKDADRFGGREGGYFLPYNKNEVQNSCIKNSYIMIVADHKFYVGSELINGATRLREMYPTLSDDDKEFFITELYDNANNNTRKILDKLCKNQ